MRDKVIKIHRKLNLVNRINVREVPLFSLIDKMSICLLTNVNTVKFYNFVFVQRGSSSLASVRMNEPAPMKYMQ